MIRAGQGIGVKINAGWDLASLNCRRYGLALVGNRSIPRDKAEATSYKAVSRQYEVTGAAGSIRALYEWPTIRTERAARFPAIRISWWEVHAKNPPSSTDGSNPPSSPY